MKRGRKLAAGNFPSWEERIDYQLRCAFDHCDRSRSTEHDLYRKVGEAEGRIDRAATNKDLIATRATLNHLLNAVVVLVLALLVFAVWSVVA